MTAELDALAARVASLVEEAGRGEVTEELVAESDAIAAELLRVLPHDDEGWQSGLEVILDPLAQRYRDDVERWNEVLESLRVYLSSAWSETPHPQQSFSGKRRGKSGHDVPFDLDERLLARLLEMGPTSGRERFFSSIAGWRRFRQLAKVLPEVALSDTEAVALFRNADEFTSGDMARGEVVRALPQWSARHAEQACALVERWLDDDDDVRLSETVVDLLIQGAVSASTDLQWRDSVLDRLRASGRESHWKLAVKVAAFAWPASPEPSVEERHAALMERVKFFPERLVAAGLECAAGDARLHPAEAIDLTLELLDLLPDDELAGEMAARVAWVARQALWGLGDREEPVGRVWQLMHRLLGLGANLDVDSMLADLLSDDPEAVREFMGGWLARHLAAVEERGSSPRELFPVLADELTPDQWMGWLMDWLTGANWRTRRAATSLVNGEGRLSLSEALLQARNDDQLVAFAHLLVASGVLARIRIPALFRLGLARASVLERIEAIVAEEAVEYPGACRRALAAWSEAATETVREAARRVEESLDHQEEIAQVKHAIPEISGDPGSYPIWEELFERQTRQALEAARANSPFLSLVQQVPIARGAESRHGARGDVAARFKAVSSPAIEFGWTEVVDPVAARLRRLKHLNAAQAALGRATEGG